MFQLHSVIHRGLRLHRGTSSSFKMAPNLSITAVVLVLFGSWLMIANSVQAAPSVLIQGFKLTANTDLDTLREGPFGFIMQQDCNLVLYKNGNPIWASNTGGLAQNCVFEMQRDGNGVVYTTSNRVIWATNTNGFGGIYIILQCDGNVVMYTQRGNPIWATNTGGRVEVIDLEEGNRLRKPSLDSIIVQTVSARA